MIKTLYVFRPQKELDWIVNVKNELDGRKLLLSTDTKLPLDKVNTGCRFYGGYYFTSKAIMTKFVENYYKKDLQKN